MATTKPRITITISPRQHELLKAISDASGSSMSSYVSELLESCEPVLERIASTMTKLRDINEQRKASVAAALDEAQTSLDPILSAVLDQYDMFASKVESAAMGPEVARASAASTADAGPDRIPRPVITGDSPPEQIGPTSAGKTSRRKSQRGLQGKIA